MNRIRRQIRVLEQRHKKALVAFITAGYPTIRRSEAVVQVLEAAGVDMIELGMPFSDPIADGPTIQESSAIALRRGMSVIEFLKLVRRLRRHCVVPLIMMTYYNPLFQYGIDRFCHDAAAAGLDGIIVPDLPCEESNSLRLAMRRHDLSLIFLISPLSSLSRSQRIAARSDGFVYFVSLAGVTGSRRSLAPHLREQLRRLKRTLTKPVFVGFGISSPAQVREVADIADGVIVGSAIIQKLNRYSRDPAWRRRLYRYVRSLQRMTRIP